MAVNNCDENGCPYCGRTFESVNALASHTGAKHDKSWIPKDELVQLYQDQRLRIQSIADRYNTTEKTINRIIDRYGIDRRDPVKERHRGLLRKPCSYYTREDGYERWSTEHCGDYHRVYVHRLLAVAKFGIEKVKNEEIHHTNNIPWDNRPGNIVLKTSSEHGLIHANERWSNNK